MKMLCLGAPGTGKSTVGRRLAVELQWNWISTGAILRESKDPQIVEMLKTGQLLDDGLVSELLFARLAGLENVIIDGYPRTLRQAEILVERGVRLDLILELSVPFEESMKRLLARGRVGETEAVVRLRWELYQRNKAEIVAFLRANGVRDVAVDAVGAREEVYQRILSKVQEALR